MNIVYSALLILTFSSLLYAGSLTQDLKPNIQIRQASANNLIVQTNNGQVQGKTIIVSQNFLAKYKVNAWLGIPFAEKPINDLRFKPPVPVKNWSGVLNTTTWPNTCYQDNSANSGLNTPLSEDCLYLNVFTPNPMPTNAAVMV
jgi:acetylcholinesterase